MDWQPVQGIPRLSPDDLWDRLQPPHDSSDELNGYRKWMDECVGRKFTRTIKSNIVRASLKDLDRRSWNYCKIQQHWHFLCERVMYPSFSHTEIHICPEENYCLDIYRVERARKTCNTVQKNNPQWQVRNKNEVVCNKDQIAVTKWIVARGWWTWPTYLPTTLKSIKSLTFIYPQDFFFFKIKSKQASIERKNCCPNLVSFVPLLSRQSILI